MTDLTELYKRLTLVLLASCTFTAGACGTDSPTVQVPPGGGSGDPPPDTGGQVPPAPPAVFSTRPSRSSTIAISDDDSHVAMVNPDDGSLSVFQTSDNSRISKTLTGPSPSAVVIAGDGSTAYVANRGDGTVTRVINIDGGTPTADARIDVGADPVGLALSPSGTKLFVAEFAEGRISVIDTQNAMTIVDTIAFDRPRALVVTNDGDDSDDNDILIASRFYGIPVDGKEAKDDGRTGLVVTWPLTSLHTGTKITLAPTDSEFPNAVKAGTTLKTSPNQLAAMAVSDNRLYITSVSASPEGPAKFDQNVYPVVYVADLVGGTEVTGDGGTTNLAARLKERLPDPDPNNPPPATAPAFARFMPGDLSDIAFLDNTQVAYTVGRAGDVVVRLDYSANALHLTGSASNEEIDLLNPAVAVGCQNPTGIALAKKAASRAYVNCWVNRRLGVIDLGSQSLLATVESSAAPTDATAIAVQAGQRFYFTGRARWSNGQFNGARGGEGWSSCGSCHPDGLTDNITWIFGAGPRQTTSMDGSFSHAPGTAPQKQRVFNWTSVNDEIHDFEANTRDVSGGLGAIVTVKTGGVPATDCGKLDKEAPVLPLNTGLVASNKQLADDASLALCPHKDWDNITAFVKTIPPVHALKFADADAVSRGQALFTVGGCAKCHGGSGWTISRRFYTPDKDGNAVLSSTSSPFTAPTLAGFAPTVFYDLDAVTGARRAQISGQPAIHDTGSALENAVGVAQVACSVRNVGTFGIPGTDATSVAATTSLELRAAPASTAAPTARAEGRGGYNVPSLYGLALGAPYLHHGQSPSLKDLFSNTKWNSHTNAGNSNFSLSLGDAGTVDDLIAYLLSIDASTPEAAVPNGFDICPGTPNQSL